MFLKMVLPFFGSMGILDNSFHINSYVYNVLQDKLHPLGTADALVCITPMRSVSLINHQT